MVNLHIHITGHHPFEWFRRSSKASSRRATFLTWLLDGSQDHDKQLSAKQWLCFTFYTYMNCVYFTQSMYAFMYILVCIYIYMYIIRIQWLNEPMKQWTNESMNPWWIDAQNSEFIFQKCSHPFVFFWRFWSANLTLATVKLAHFANFIFGRCSGPPVLLRLALQSKFFEMQTELSLQSRIHFANFIFETCSEGAARSKALPTVSCAFCQLHFPKVSQDQLSLQSCAVFVESFPRSRPATAETETLLQQPQKPHYPKNQGFAPESVLTCEFTLTITALASFVVTMMMMMMMMMKNCPWKFVRNSDVRALSFLWMLRFIGK